MSLKAIARECAEWVKSKVTFKSNITGKNYVVYTDNSVYGIETNFYASSGSKLNETARSYKTLALESKTIPGFTFVWFTDGKGWNKARHNLEETFDVLEHVYNIKDMEDGIMAEVFQ